jgi:hypothetical protein
MYEIGGGSVSVSFQFLVIKKLMVEVIGKPTTLSWQLALKVVNFYAFLSQCRGCWFRPSLCIGSIPIEGTKY